MIHKLTRHTNRGAGFRGSGFVSLLLHERPTPHSRPRHVLNRIRISRRHNRARRRHIGIEILKGIRYIKVVRRSRGNPHQGSNFNDFLRSEGILDEVNRRALEKVPPYLQAVRGNLPSDIDIDKARGIIANTSGIELHLSRDEIVQIIRAGRTPRRHSWKRPPPGLFANSVTWSNDLDRKWELKETENQQINFQEEIERLRKEHLEGPPYKFNRDELYNELVEPIISTADSSEEHSGTSRWEPIDHLKTDQYIHSYLQAALENGDPAIIMAVLANIARAVADRQRQKNRDRPVKRILNPDYHYTYQIIWSGEDNEYVGLCQELPGSSWLAADPVAALQGIREVVAMVISELNTDSDTKL